jgi:hypothetical protein
MAELLDHHQREEDFSFATQFNAWPFRGSSEQSRLALVLEPVALAVDVYQGNANDHY